MKTKTESRVTLAKGRRYCLYLLLFVCSLCPIILAEDVRPFTVEAKVVFDQYRPGDKTPFVTSRTVVTFASSNRWWEIESQQDQGPKPAIFVNCRRIPNGVRFFTAMEGQAAGNAKAQAPATAYPFAYPLPEYLDHLACWLCFCPEPELPILSEGRIGRFIRSELQEDPAHLGMFQLSYLPGQRQSFVSNLVITNDGTSYLADKRLFHYRPPFDKGFVEFRYEVTQTTNYNGQSFPVRATLSRMAPSGGTNSANDLYAAFVAQIELKSVSSGIRDFHVPPVMDGEDKRQFGVAANIIVPCSVTNDTWPEVTSNGVKRSATLAAQTQQIPKALFTYGLAFLLLAACLVSVPLFLLRRKSRRQSTLDVPR